MTTRTLKIQIDPTGLEILAAADQLVALVKSTTTPPSRWSGRRSSRSRRTRSAGTNLPGVRLDHPLTPGATIQTVVATGATGGDTYPFAVPSRYVR